MDLFFKFLVVGHDLCFFFSKFGELVLLAASFGFELKQLVVEFVGYLVKRNEHEMTKSRHYSDECLNELKAKLATLGLSFGMRDF